MRWPADHPAVTDEALAPWRVGAEELCPEGTVVRVLRHLAGRRVATLVETRRGLAVLKVFASPRARGNDRRLASLGRSTASHLVPASLGVDRSGHVALIDWVHGEVFDQLPDDGFVAAAPVVGRALATLHACGAALDRRWTFEDEVAQLHRRATDATSAMVEETVARALPVAGAPLVSAHRDCHPRQVVATEGGVRWIDLDDAAMAPAGLDVGNFTAHLRRDQVFGDRRSLVTAAAVEGFLRGYRGHPHHPPSDEVDTGRLKPPIDMGNGTADAGDIEAWEELALLRLAGLAETRHQRPDRSLAILALLAAGRGHDAERSAQPVQLRGEPGAPRRDPPLTASVPGDDVDR
ncbi:MAG: hypothetical protein ACR2LA_09655 [Acidimicrobiales bacterium]